MDNILSKALLLLMALLTLVACGNSVEVTGPAGETDVLFMDDFSIGEAHQWETEQDDQGSTSIQNGEMVIDIHTINTLQFTTLRETVFDDFSLEVDVTAQEGNPESSMGVLFRMQDTDQFYRFEIMGDGRFMVERRNGDGTWTRFLDDWQSSPALGRGLNNTNRLKVVTRGSQMAFFANDELLQEINDSTYTGGQIALDGGTFGHVPLRVAFDNLVITRP